MCFFARTACEVLSLCRQRKYPKKTAPLSQNTASLMYCSGGLHTGCPYLVCRLAASVPPPVGRNLRCFNACPSRPHGDYPLSVLGMISCSFHLRVKRGGFQPHGLVRGGKAFLYHFKSATGMSRPVLLSQDGESKPGTAKRFSRHTFAPARGVLLLVTFLGQARKVTRHSGEAAGESIKPNCIK